METIRFLHPETKIPMIATWSEERETVMFDFENYDSTDANYTPEVIEEVYNWCMHSHINCYSMSQANKHLMFLGISERFSIK